MKANETNSPAHVSTENISAPSESEWLKIVEQQVKALRFGSVSITVHESRVVQVETSVRVRFDKTR